MESFYFYESLVIFIQIGSALPMYKRLAREGVELPQSLINQFLGLCAYFKASPAHVALLERDPSAVSSVILVAEEGSAEKVAL